MRDFLLSTASWYGLNFYKKHGLIGIYPDSYRVDQVVDPKVFDFDDNVRDVGYDGNISFMSQFQSLFQSVKVPAFHHFTGAENCGFSNHVSNTQNSYLSFHTTGNCQDVLYSLSTKINSYNVYNSVMTWVDSANIYQCLGIIKSSNIFYSKYIINSTQVWGSHNLVNCEECIYCEHLENKKYCIRNIQYLQEEYEIQKHSILSNMSEIETYYWSMIAQGVNYASTNCEGSFVTDSVDVRGSRSHFVKHGTNVFFSGHADGLTDAYSALLSSGGSMYYNSCAIGGDSERIYCSFGLRKCFDVYYSYYLESCSFCLGCIGLKNKSYCILNKQYSKEERYQKVDEIFSKMEEDGTLGQFFPATMNPFYFNDTAAYLIDPSFTKEEVTARGYLWRDEPIKVDIPAGAEVVITQELDNFEKLENGEWTIDSLILKKIIQDEEGNVYRIVPMEYEFLMKHGLPLPRRHWLNRIKANF